MEIEQVVALAAAIRGELKKAIVGQDAVLNEATVALLSGGHVLLEGPPGTAKTLLVRALAATVAGAFRRIQFTPDLMPADLLGVNVYRTEKGVFEFRPGPLFCDLLLGDEINRAPAKTQSALLEAMQERQVTVDGDSRALSPVFTTFATQNPIEYEGTYPLPEAQLDRFMFKTVIGYPEQAAEEQILVRHQQGFDAAKLATAGIVAVTSVPALQDARATLERLQVAPAVLRYITAIVRATRSFHLLTLGCSPRAAVMLLYASRTMAVLRGRNFVTPDDVRDLAAPTLRHRLILRPEAEIEGISPDECIRQIVAKVEVPRLAD